jgi:protein-S-isoprenylcysteine O-methyltransferase Ste14
VSAIVCGVGVMAEMLTTIVVAVSIVFPRHRIWPPDRPHSPGQAAMLSLFVISAICVVLVGVLDWGSFVFPVWLRILAGLPLGLAGNGLALWAMIALGLHPTAGEGSALIQRGPYRFSRNPQYAGFILALAGWVLISNSMLALIVSCAGVIPLVLVPFAEEPWLVERLGAAYTEYKRSVPRFIGARKK